MISFLEHLFSEIQLKAYVYITTRRERTSTLANACDDARLPFELLTSSFAEFIIHELAALSDRGPSSRAILRQTARKPGLCQR